MNFRGFSLELVSQSTYCTDCGFPLVWQYCIPNRALWLEEAAMLQQVQENLDRLSYPTLQLRVPEVLRRINGTTKAQFLNVLWGDMYLAEGERLLVVRFNCPRIAYAGMRVEKLISCLPFDWLDMRYRAVFKRPQ